MWNVMETPAPPLRVAGVPEAFNDCWENADFSGLEAGAEFIPHPGGSGSMLKAVLAGEVDAAFALTDCIVAAIENGSPVRLAGPLVTSPLTWAVTVAGSGAIASLDALSNATWGISRMGSGSHVMVQTLAKRERWTTAPKFEICGNFEGLRSAVNEGRIDAFLWEHFTTRPFEEKGEVRIIAGVVTLWGCFSVVVRKDCQRIEEIRKMTDAFLNAGEEFLQNAGSSASISAKYGMSENDAKNWLQGVQYANSGERVVSKDELEVTRSALLEARVIKEYLCPGGVDSYHV